MINPSCHETRQNIRSDEIKEDELIDIVSKEFWDSVKYIEPENNIKLVSVERYKCKKLKQ